MKVAIISDAHLFHTFSENYDSTSDLKRALDNIGEKQPDLLFLAGDMFDYMKTETVYLRHYEGEGHMVDIRNLFRVFGKPIYAVRGNHDKDEILKGLEQTVEDFHYVNGVNDIGNVSVCFMNSFYETGGYAEATTKLLVDFLNASIQEMKSSSKKKILLCHETFAPYPNAIDESVVELMKRSFDLVLDGHMHIWNPSAYSSDQIICLPSLLPSKIAKGKYLSERYTWSNREQEPKRTLLKSSFGYVILDTESLKVEFHEFVPSKKIVEVELNVTGIFLEEARSRLRRVYSDLIKRQDRKELIVLPVLSGEMVFSKLYLDNIREEFHDLFIDTIRDDTRSNAVLSGGSVSAPSLSVQELQEKIRKEVPTIVNELQSKNVNINESVVSTIITKLLDEDLLIRSQSIGQTATRLRTILDPVMEAISGFSETQRPTTFEDNLVNLLRRVK